MKALIGLLVVGILIFGYALFFASPPTAYELGNRAELAMLGLCIMFLSMAGIVGGGK